MRIGVPMVTIAVRIRQTNVFVLKRLARKQGISVSWYVNKLIEKDLKLK